MVEIEAPLPDPTASKPMQKFTSAFDRSDQPRVQALMKEPEWAERNAVVESLREAGLSESELEKRQNQLDSLESRISEKGYDPRHLSAAVLVDTGHLAFVDAKPQGAWATLLNRVTTLLRKVRR